MSAAAAVVPFRARPMAAATLVGPLAERWLASLRARGYARRTLDAYQRDVEQFAGYLEQACDVTLLDRVRAHHVEDWITALVQAHGMSPRTAARKLESVRGLVSFAIARDLLREDPTRAVTVRFTAAPVVAPPEKTLLRVIESIPTATPHGLRDRAMFRLMMDSALRVGGVLSLDVYDEGAPPQHCVQPSGVVTYLAKGGATKTTVVGDETLALVAEWGRARARFERRASPPALFLSARGTRLTASAVDMRLKHWARLLGLHLHCHMFRHRRLGDVMVKGDVQLAQFLAGHARPSTTINVYGAIAAERLRERVRRECPLGEGVGA